MNVFDKIKNQQTEEGTPVWMVGEQLAEMIRQNPEAQEIVSRDLDVEGMGLKDCEKKIKAFADKHRKGNFACVIPVQAEKIIREFYGLPSDTPTTPAAMEVKPEREQPVQAPALAKPTGPLSLDNFF